MAGGSCGSVDASVAMELMRDSLDDPVEVRREIDRVLPAVSRRWDDALGQMYLSDLYLQSYRIQLYRKLRSERPWEEASGQWAATTLEAQLDRQYRTPTSDASLRAEAATRDARVQQARRFASSAAYVWNARAWMRLSGLHLLCGQPNEAGEAARQAERFAGGDPATWLRLGWLAMLADDMPRAAKCWERCLELDPARAEDVVRVASDKTLERGEMRRIKESLGRN